MTELSNEFQKKLEELAQANDEKVADVTVLFMALKDKITEIEPQLSDMKANIRTYNGLLNYYSNKKFNKGQEFIIIPMGIQQEPQDTNKKLRDEILKDFSNPQKRQIMISGVSGTGKDSKVMTMKTSDAVIDNKTVFFYDVYKPVKTIRKMTQLANGDWVVIDGDLWKPGDKPIPRNYQKTIQYVEGGEEYTNRGWGRPLNPNWKMAIFGVGYFSGMKGQLQKTQKNPIEDGLVTRVTFYGDHADPNSPKFICKKNLWFKPCKLKAVDSKYSNELFLQITSKTDIEVSSKKLKITDIIGKINERILNKANKLDSLIKKTNFEELPKEKAKKLQDADALYKKYKTVDYIPVIDLFGIHTYHMTHRAKPDENGVPQKDDSGTWDAIDFNSFAIAECAFSGVYTKEGKAPKMILSDYSLPENQNLFAKFSNGIDSELPPSSVYVSITTARGNQAYDPDTKQFIVDPENAVAMPKIRGIGVIMDFSKIDIEQLLGDM